MTPDEPRLHRLRDALDILLNKGLPMIDMTDRELEKYQSEYGQFDAVIAGVGLKFLDKNGIYWCNAHQREATHKTTRGFCCDPKLGGILAPCDVIFAEVEITNTNQ